MESLMETGIEWIGEMPAEWQITKIGSVFSQRSVKVSDEDFEPLSVTKNGVIPQMESAAKSDDHENRKLVLAGDFVINSRSDRKMSAGTSMLNGSVSLINTVLYSNIVAPEFANYLLKNSGFAEEFYRWGTGIVSDLWTTNYQRMKNISIPLPDMSEQKRIAQYLDQKTRQIDKLISDTELSIDGIKEFRKSKLNELVNRGNSTDFEESQNRWVGEKPKNWQVLRMKNLVNLVSEKTQYQDGMEFLALENVEGFTGVIKGYSTEIESGMQPFASEGMVVFNKLRPYLTKATVLSKSVNLSSEFLVFKPKPIIEPDFLKYKLLSPSFIEAVNSSSYGSKMPRAKWDFIANVSVSVPGLEEQQNLVHEIDELFATTSELLNDKTLLIDQLQQYKQSIIFEVVTGKKRV